MKQEVGLQFLKHALLHKLKGLLVLYTGNEIIQIRIDVLKYEEAKEHARKQLRVVPLKGGQVWHRNRVAIPDDTQVKDSQVQVLEVNVEHLLLYLE